MIVLVVLAVAWLVVGAPVALALGRGIRLADARTPEPDLLADQPVAVLAPAEIRRRIAAFEEDLAA